MKRIALLAASGLISMLPSIASARPHFFFFAPPVPIPVIAPPVFVPPPIVGDAPVVVAPAPFIAAPVFCAPAPVVVDAYPHWYYGYGPRHEYGYRHWRW
jgi:hypothetical protein